MDKTTSQQKTARAKTGVNEGLGVRIKKGQHEDDERPDNEKKKKSSARKRDREEKKIKKRHWGE